MGTREKPQQRIPAHQNPPVEEENQTAEEEERASDTDGSPAAASESASQVADVLERESEPLQEGRALDSPVGPLPVRSLWAMAAFLAVAVAVYLAIWGVLGTLGLLLGWIPAAALGLFAAREVGRRVDA